MRVLTALLLALVLAGCQPAAPAQQPTDLTPVTEAVAGLEAQVVALMAQVEALGARVVALDDNVRARMGELVQAATDLNAVVSQPLDLSRVDFASVEVLVVTTTAAVLPFLLIEPGECPAELAAPRNWVATGEAVVTVAWPAPTGPHCVRYEGEGVAFGAVVDVPAGAIGGVTLLAPLE